MADIERAKGAMILLVVFGHLVARQAPPGAGLYEALRGGVYQFHMPVFMYLSGFVAWRAGWPGWRRYAAARALRLLLPFGVFGVSVIAGKLMFSRVIAVDNVPDGFGAGLAGLVWDTANSPALAVWYLFALFVFSVVWLPVARCCGGWGALALSLALFAVKLPPVLYLDRLGGFGVFFVAGAAARQAGGAWDRVLARWYWAALALCAGLAAGRDGGRVALLICGLLALPAVHGWARHAAPSWWAWLGRRSFAIYLGNTVAIGLAKGGLLLAVAWDSRDFWPFAGVLMLAGVLGPVAVQNRLIWAVSAIARLGGWKAVVSSPSRLWLRPSALAARVKRRASRSA